MQGLRHVFAIFVTASFLLCLVPGEAPNLEKNNDRSNVNENNYGDFDWELSGMSGIERFGGHRYLTERPSYDSESFGNFKIENFDFDTLGNLYIAIFSNQGNLGTYSFSGDGLHVVKFSPQGDVLWSELITTSFCGKRTYANMMLGCNVISIDVIEEDQFYLTFGVNGAYSLYETLEFDTVHQYTLNEIRDNPKHITAFYNQTNWDWVEIIDSEYFGMSIEFLTYVSDLRYLSTNSNGELITVRENTVTNIGCQLGSCVTSKVNITMFNDKGIFYTDDLTYTKNDDSLAPNLLAAHDNSNLSIFMHVAGQLSRNNQEYSCPSNSENDYCLMSINYDYAGNFQLIQSIPQPNVLFSAMSLHHGDLLLTGTVIDWLDSDNSYSTNFTGTLWFNNSFSTSELTYVTAKLSSSGWDYVNHFQVPDYAPPLLEDYNTFFDINGNTILTMSFRSGALKIDNVSLSTPRSINTQNYGYNSVIFMFDSAGNLITEQYIDGENDQEIRMPTLKGDVMALLIWNDHHTYSTTEPGFFSYGNFTSSQSPRCGDTNEYWEYQSILIFNTTLGEWRDEIITDSMINCVNDQDWIAICPLSFTAQHSLMTYECYGSTDFYDSDVTQLDNTIHFFSIDRDNDDYGFFSDNCVNDYNPNQENYDSDDFGDICDDDDDNDQIPDVTDVCVLGYLGWNSSSITDHDVDGCHDIEEDLDDDNDAISDLSDLCPLGLTGQGNDHDGEGCKNAEDSDDDNDLISDGEDFCPLGSLEWLAGKVTDFDGDGCKDDVEDDDDDNDGVLDVDDQCQRGEINWKSNRNTDFDADGCLDDVEDEDNDNDGVYNFEDDCAYSNGTVDENGCTTEQSQESQTNSQTNNSMPSVMYVCQGGTMVVLDITDCPDGNDISVNQTNNSEAPTFYYVCQSGQLIVSDYADCPEGANSSNEGVNLSLLNVDNLTLVLSPNNTAPQGYLVCPGGTAFVIDANDCPSLNSQDESNSDPSSVQDTVASDGMNNDSDGMLTYMVGGAFILSIISVLIVVLRPTGTRDVDDIDLMIKSHHNDQLDVIPPSPSEPMMAPISVSDKPPSFEQGNVSEGYEWLEWPKGSKKNWYRVPGTNSEWTKWD